MEPGHQLLILCERVWNGVPIASIVMSTLATQGLKEASKLGGFARKRQNSNFTCHGGSRLMELLRVLGNGDFRWCYGSLLTNH